jgi:hypothetical protein
MATARLAATILRQMFRARFPGRQAETLISAIDALKQDVDAINTCVNNLVTAQNTLATKLNADAGVTDTNYAAANAGTGV